MWWKTFVARKSHSGHPVDRLVGHRVFLLRKAAGLSQTQLGAALGVSFQQVQKYEKGTNRISASRLFAIANELGVKVGDLFADANSVTDEEVGRERKGGGLSPIDIKIASALTHLSDANVKRRIYDLVSAAVKAQ